MGPKDVNGGIRTFGYNARQINSWTVLHEKLRQPNDSCYRLFNVEKTFFFFISESKILIKLKPYLRPKAS